MKIGHNSNKILQTPFPSIIFTKKQLGKSEQILI